MRLEIIYNHGGFIVNFEILKPLYNLLNNNYHFVGCNEVPRFKKYWIFIKFIFWCYKT